jgi:hypothetical protein
MMTTAGFSPAANNMTFPGPIATKRRRMRSGGNVSSATNNVAKGRPDSPESPLPDDEMSSDDQKTTQTSKCKGATTIPIFLKSKFVRSVRDQSGAE